MSAKISIEVSMVQFAAERLRLVARELDRNPSAFGQASALHGLAGSLEIRLLAAGHSPGEAPREAAGMTEAELEWSIANLETVRGMNRLVGCADIGRLVESRRRDLELELGRRRGADGGKTVAAREPLDVVG